MAVTTKLVNGVSIPLTAEDIAEMEAMDEAADLDLQLVRGNRDSLLSGSDWSVLEDAGLGEHTKEEWVTYRQALRDHMAQSDRVSTFPAMPEDPPTAKITRKTVAGQEAYDAAIASDSEDIAAAQAAYDTAYAATD